MSEDELNVRVWLYWQHFIWTGEKMPVHRQKVEALYHIIQLLYPKFAISVELPYRLLSKDPTLIDQLLEKPFTFFQEKILKKALFGDHIDTLTKGAVFEYESTLHYIISFLSFGILRINSTDDRVHISMQNKDGFTIEVFSDDSKRAFKELIEKINEQLICEPIH